MEKSFFKKINSNDINCTKKDFELSISHLNHPSIEKLRIKTRKIIAGILYFADKYKIDKKDPLIGKKIINKLLTSDDFYNKGLGYHLNTILEYGKVKQVNKPKISGIEKKDCFFDNTLNIKGNTIVSLIKINGMPNINSLLGNSVGDKVLDYIYKEITLVLSQEGFNTYKDTPTTFGIIKDISNNEENIESIINKNKELLNLLIRKLIKYVKENIINDEFKEDSTNINFHISCGLKVGKSDLYHDVHFALFHSMNSGNLVVYRDLLVKSISKKIYRIHKIEEAILQKKLQAHFQPIIENKTCKIYSFESLVRLIDGDKIVYPGKFLPYIEGSDTLGKISNFMIDEIFKKIEGNNFKFSVNLTENDFKNEILINKILLKFVNKKINPNRLIVEILEEITQGNNKVNQTIQRLKSFGVKVAIDDFGKGYSNFMSMIHYKPNIVKLDGELVRNLKKGSTQYLFIQGIVQAAKKEGLKIVAEFVENEEIYKLICELGINYSQGYYFGKPSKDI